MATTYILDGYNLLHAMGVLQGKVGPRGLEGARLRLQGLLAGALGDEAANVTLVFDAARAPQGSQAEQCYKGLRILFALGQEADDLIETLIAHHATPKNLVVVSSDHRLQDAARRRHAQAMTCEQFLDFLERRRARPASSPSRPEKKERLTPEETQRWLEEFAGMEDDPGLKEAFEKYDFEDEE